MLYDYDRRPVGDYDRRHRVASTTLQLLEQFDDVVSKLEKRATEILQVVETDRYALMRLGVILPGSFDLALRHGAGLLFLNILREYSMSPRDRKVIERASKVFSKRQMNRIKPEKALQTYEKALQEFKLFAQTARDVMTRNEKYTDHDSDSAPQPAGSFKLINTGGFPSEVMAEAVKVVEKAERLIRAKALGRVCYGDIYVTNTVHKSTRVLAFYRLSDDSMYIRANLKGKQGPAVQSVIHELGHRLQFRFLKSKKRDIDTVYQTLARKRNNAHHEVVMDRSRWPKAGDTHLYKGETFVFDKVDVTNRSDLVAIFRLPEVPKMSIRMPLAAYVMSKHPEMGTEASVFVSNYASTDPDENFAEMIAYHCEDLLPDDQVEMLKAIL